MSYWLMYIVDVGSTVDVYIIYIIDTMNFTLHFGEKMHFFYLACKMLLCSFDHTECVEGVHHTAIGIHVLGSNICEKHETAANSQTPLINMLIYWYHVCWLSKYFTSCQTGQTLGNTFKVNRVGRPIRVYRRMDARFNTCCTSVAAQGIVLRVRIVLLKSTEDIKISSGQFVNHQLVSQISNCPNT